MTDPQKAHTTHPRPLSPHLEVYRLPMTALMSISHRITGVILAGGCLLITAFFVAAAMGPDAYNIIMNYAGTPWGALFMFAWSFVLYYHLCNGIRHLLWDMVLILDEKDAIGAGWIVLLATAMLTSATWCAVSIW